MFLAAELIVVSVSSQHDRFVPAQLGAGSEAARGALSAATVTGALIFSGFAP